MDNIFCKSLKLAALKYIYVNWCYRRIYYILYTRAFSSLKWCWVNRDGSWIYISVVKHRMAVSLLVVLGCCRS